MFDKSIINGKVYINHAFIKTNIYLQGEKIAKISDEIYASKQVIDANHKMIIPGLIDPHTHMALDLKTIHSVDDFASGSISGLYGGVTTIIDFLEPTSCASDLEKSFYSRLNEAKDCHCDYKFHATIKNPTGSLEEYVLKVKELGLTSIKLFTTYSNSNRRTYDADIIELLKLSQIHHILILAHIENDDLIDLNPDFTYQDLPISRPSISETKEALKLASFVKKYGGYLYMVHLSSGETLQKLKEQYSDILNKKFFVESCPQYFNLSNDLLKQENGYLYTMAPPIRRKEELVKLVSLFSDVYTIGTDHCSFMKKEKNHLLLKDIPLGIGGIESSFHLMYHLFNVQAIDKMTLNPASIHHLLGKKGKIEEGYDADLVIYELANSAIEKLHSKCDYSVYQGYPTDEIIKFVLLRGNIIIEDQNNMLIEGQFIKSEDY
jgi:dihydropyrimidinase